MKDEEGPLIKSDIEMQRDVSDGDATLTTKTSSLVMPNAAALQVLLLLLSIFLLCGQVHAQEMKTSATI